MTTKKARELEDDAILSLRNDNLSSAGQRFTRTAYEYLGASEFTNPATWAAHGLKYLAIAAVCFGMDGQDQSCINRCTQGLLIADEIRRDAYTADPPANFYDRARRGVWWEFMGDYHLIARVLTDRDILDTLRMDLPDTDPYEEAIDTYAAENDPVLSLAESEHLREQDLVYILSLAVGETDEYESLVHAEPENTLSDLVRYKQSEYPRILRQLETQGHWLETPRLRDEQPG